MLSKQYFEFFKGLEKNNSRDWFEAHRSDYENHVKGPFSELVEQLIEKIRKIEPDLHITPKDAIFRINRDIRFSKDKSPYKTHSSALITRFGKKSPGKPGMYIEIGAKGGGVAGGCYEPDKESLASIRDLVMNESKELHKLMKAKAFVSAYECLQGEKNKVLPAEFKDAALKEPLLYNKQFYWWKQLPIAAFTDKKCVQNLFDMYKAGKPLSDFFIQAFE